MLNRSRLTSFNSLPDSHRHLKRMKNKDQKLSFNSLPDSHAEREIGMSQQEIAFNSLPDSHIIKIAKSNIVDYKPFQFPTGFSLGDQISVVATHDDQLSIPYRILTPEHGSISYTIKTFQFPTGFSHFIQDNNIVICRELSIPYRILTIYIIHSWGLICLEPFNSLPDSHWYDQDNGVAKFEILSIPYRILTNFPDKTVSISNHSFNSLPDSHL